MQFYSRTAINCGARIPIYVSVSLRYCLEKFPIILIEVSTNLKCVERSLGDCCWNLYCLDASWDMRNVGTLRSSVVSENDACEMEIALDTEQGWVTAAIIDNGMVETCTFLSLGSVRMGHLQSRDDRLETLHCIIEVDGDFSSVRVA